jgi:hypothetical protein
MSECVSTRLGKADPLEVGVRSTRLAARLSAQSRSAPHPAASEIEAVPHGLQPLFRVTGPVDKLAYGAQRLAAAKGLRRTPGNLLFVTLGSYSNLLFGSTM